MDPQQRWLLETSYKALENGECYPTSTSLLLSAKSNLLQLEFHQKPLLDHRRQCSLLPCPMTTAESWLETPTKHRPIPRRVLRLLS